MADAAFFDRNRAPLDQSGSYARFIHGAAPQPSQTLGRIGAQADYPARLADDCRRCIRNAGRPSRQSRLGDSIKRFGTEMSGWCHGTKFLIFSAFVASAIWWY